MLCKQFAVSCLNYNKKDLKIKKKYINNLWNDISASKIKECRVNLPQLQDMKHLENISCNVSHWPLTVKAWVQSARSQRGICGRLNGTGTHFYHGTSVFSGQDHSSNVLYSLIHQSTHNVSIGCWYVLSPTRKETSYSDRRFWRSYILFRIIIGGILVLFIYITRLASNKIFLPSNKMHREVGRAKDLSTPQYSNWQPYYT